MRYNALLGSSKRNSVKLESFKSIAYENKEASGQYSYQMLTSGKSYSVPVLMSITVLLNSRIESFEPDYYNFKNVEVINGQWVHQ